jgi:ribonucleoside-diphosphate reductase alpha chain
VTTTDDVQGETMARQGFAQQGMRAVIDGSRTGLTFEHVFTDPDVHPYDELQWEQRDAVISDWKTGEIAFEQRGVEFPTSWSMIATNIVSQKYFRGTPGTPEREHSVRQMIDRVVDTITGWGIADGYFADDDAAEAFSAELKHLLVHQKAAFNSPVWFNCGVEETPQCSACFILSVEDKMSSILNWYVEEGTIFKGGSGAGVNLSNIRSSVEKLKGGGEASGPVSFMRGADASAGTIKSGGKTRRAAKMVMLNVDHPDIEEFIWCKQKEEEKSRALAAAGFDMSLDGADSASVQYQNANNSVRVTDEFMQAVIDDADFHLREVITGKVTRTLRARDLMRQMSEAGWACADPGIQYDSTINDWHTTPNAGRINGSNPCSEYMHLDDSACNLASLNLRKFETGGQFDVDGFRHAVQVVFTAQEIIVGNSSYPTERIGANALKYRQLGMGYANLGGLLMSLGLAYDSDAGRAWAGAITALMTGQAYATSAEIAKVTGPFDGYADDRDGMLRVLRKHRAAVTEIDQSLAPADVMAAAAESWDTAVATAEDHGVRNAQATVLAPTGTIGLMMDCDTTGIEPDLGLVKSKKLVGGGSMRIVNQTVPHALANLGYQPEQVEAIVAYIDEHATVEGAPALKAEHISVFDCAMGDRPISPMGHIKMMAAAQPFLSGAISKTVNLPETATVEDVEETYIEGWRLGLKAIAIYRDNCKVAQPLSIDSKKTRDAAAAADLAAAPAATTAEAAIVRRRLPKQRPSQTISFQVGDADGYLTAGEYPGDGLGEIFVKLGKQGSTLSGIMDALAISVSVGLQYGVPLEAFVSKFINTRYEPAGMTDDPDVRFATSLTDYIFRKLAIEYLPAGQRQAMGIYTTAERTAELDGGTTTPVVADPVADVTGQTVLPVEPAGEHDIDAMYGDSPMCGTCGVSMNRAGACHVCPSCGETSGCS